MWAAKSVTRALKAQRSEISLTLYRLTFHIGKPTNTEHWPAWWHGTLHTGCFEPMEEPLHRPLTMTPHEIAGCQRPCQFPTRNPWTRPHLRTCLPSWILILLAFCLSILVPFPFVDGQVHDDGGPFWVKPSCLSQNNLNDKFGAVVDGLNWAALGTGLPFDG